MSLLTRRRLPLLLLSLVLGAVSCSDQRSVTDPRNLVPPQAGKEIVDGNHGGGNTDVFFLPPIVGNPSKATGYGDPFQPGLVVSFVVTDLTTNGVVKTFSNVPFDATAQFYYANWNTKTTAVDTSHHYRIAVIAGSKNVAHADVVFGANAASLKNVDTNDFITLVDGQTLPIKVRIERGWDCLDKTSCVTQVVPTTFPSTQPVIVTTGGTLPNSIKFTSNSDGLWATKADGSPLTGPVTVTIQDITSLHPETVGGCASGLGLKLSQNHCIQITADPQIKLVSPATVGTCLANPGDDRQLLVKYSTDPTHPEPTRFLADAPPPDNCPVQIGSAIRSSNPLVRFAATTFDYLGRGLNWVTGVHTAYAFDTGMGGTIGIGDGFSVISPAFPQQLSASSGDGQQAIQGQQVAADLVVDLSYIHDVGEGGLSPYVTGASLTCKAVTPGANFTAAHVDHVAATDIGNGKYSCGRPFLSQAPGLNQFTVTADGLLDGVLFDTGGESIPLAGSVTFNEQSLLTPIVGVSINPSSLNLQVGDQPVLNATVTLREGAEASTAVSWSLVSSAPNGVIDFKPANNATEVIANAVGTATLRATSTVDPTKFADVPVAVTPSFYGEVNDPAGDALQTSPASDLTFASVAASRGNVDIVVRFAPGTLGSNSQAIIALDTDLNPSTGYPGVDGGGVRDGTILGVNYLITFEQSANGGKAQLFHYEGDGLGARLASIGALTTSIVSTDNGSEIHISVPLASLGAATGELTFAVTSDNQISDVGFTSILDVMPDAGTIGRTIQTVPQLPPPIGLR